MVLIDNQLKMVLISSLINYIENEDCYNVRYGIIGSSEFDDIEYGLSPSKAENIVNQLNSDNLLIDDAYVNDILCIILTYKESINKKIKSEELSEDDVSASKAKRKQLNTLIRFVKTYATQYNISPPRLSDAGENFPGVF